MVMQGQRAGSGAVQVQAQGDLVLGITEQRAAEIATERARAVVADYAQESQALVQKRIVALDDRTIAALIRSGRLDAFADPAFQRTYTKAQFSAAASERGHDYEMLAALLADRAERGQERKVLAGIERAIEVIDQLDDDALRAVTVVSAVQQYWPKSGLIGPGLDSIDRFLSQLVDGPLPNGIDWMEHLDLLDVLRIDFVQGFRRFDDWYPERFSGYMAPGVESDSAPTVVDGLPLNWGDTLVDHELRPGFRRVAAVNEFEFRSSLIGRNLEATTIDLIVTQARDVFGLASSDEGARERLVEEIHKRATLSLVARWFDQLPHHIKLTSAGRVLARANAYRLDTNRQLPPLT